MIPKRVTIIQGEADITAHLQKFIHNLGARCCHVCGSPFRLALVVAEFDDLLPSGESGKIAWACYGEHAEATAAEGACTDF